MMANVLCRQHRSKRQPAQERTRIDQTLDGREPEVIAAAVVAQLLAVASATATVRRASPSTVEILEREFLPVMSDDATLDLPDLETLELAAT